jgi:uncharacterized protein (DUF362 family)
MNRTFKRREFIKLGTSAVVGTGLTFGSGFKSVRGAAPKSRVIEVHNPEVLTSSRKINSASVRQMLQQGIKSLAGKTGGWHRFVHPRDRVGLKINCLGRPMLYTHHELIDAVIAELRDIGVPANNIIVWDRFENHMKDCGFVMNRSSSGVRFCGTEVNPDEKTLLDDSLHYESTADNPQHRHPTLGTKSLLSLLFTETCDKIINMAVLKDHGYAGYTLSLKNLAFGLSHNNSRFHGPEHIGPFISDFCALPQIRQKVVLHMIDGLEACFENGPVPRNPRVLYAPRKLWLGTDPVSLDVVGREAIESKRREEGLPSLRAAGRPTDHIELSARKKVGIADKTKIEVIRINSED